MEFELREQFFRDAKLSKQKNHHTHSLRISRPLEPVLLELPEVQMLNHARWRLGASFLVLSLIIGPAAFAAAENSGQEKPSQAEPDSKSYLPPWMQGQGGGEKASTPANSAASANTTTPERKSAAADNEPIKRRVRSGSQAQRSHRHAQSDGIMGGFVGFFGGR